jgi:hypothetical protein
MTNDRLVPIEFGSHDVAYDGTETRTRVVMAGAGSLIALIDAVQRGRAISWVGHVLVEFDNHLVPPGPVTMVLDEDDLKALFAVRDALLKKDEVMEQEQDANHVVIDREQAIQEVMSLRLDLDADAPPPRWAVDGEGLSRAAAMRIVDGIFSLDSKSVAVAEDPVRKAARKLIKDGWAAYEIRTYTAEGQQLILALRDALAKPAPPSLTGDERTALLAELRLARVLHTSYLMDDELARKRALESAREKLS